MALKASMKLNSVNFNFDKRKHPWGVYKNYCRAGVKRKKEFYMKRNKFFSLVTLTLALALTVVLPGCGKKEYKLGDTGPAGGLIFYDKGESSYGWRYLEAAPVDTEFTYVEWGAYEHVDGTYTVIGSGKQNTQVIGEKGPAAQLCDSLVKNGYKDWFLPSKDELNLMYENLVTRGLGGFSDDMYWSSSESTNNYYCAWRQWFSTGEQNYQYDFGARDKSSALSARAVRAF
jgi:hypothetical protein